MTASKDNTCCGRGALFPPLRRWGYVEPPEGPCLEVPTLLAALRLVFLEARK
jgi:hypothetical protein